MSRQRFTRLSVLPISRSTKLLFIQSNFLSRKGVKLNRNRRHKTGTITIKGSEKDEGSNKISFHIGARSFLVKNELILQLSTPTSHLQTYTMLRTTEPRQNIKKGFEWSPFTIIANKLPDEKALVKFEVLEKTKAGQRVPIGEVEVPMSTILGHPGRVIKIVKAGLVVGELRILDCKKVTRYTFLNYVYAGADISLIIAMDFTNSNKDPSHPKSLHNVSSGTLHN